MMKQRIFVAGHRGMVGSAIVRLLATRDNVELVLRTRDELNLLDARAVQQFLPPNVSTVCTGGGEGGWNRGEQYLPR